MMLVLGLGPVLKDSLRTVGKSLVLALALSVKSLEQSLEAHMIFLCVADITLAQSLFMYNKYPCSSLIKLKFKFILWYNALRPELPQATVSVNFFPLATVRSSVTQL